MLIEVIIFSYGLLIGSFLNVVICRLPEGKSIVKPRSKCSQCETTLGPIDLIPLFSFMLFKGKCRYCEAEISYQYPIVELLTGIIFLLLYFKYGLSYYFLIYVSLSSLLIASTVIDLKHYIIPNQLNYLGIGLGLSFSIFFEHLTFSQSLQGVSIPAFILLIIVIVSRGGMGIGDVKFIALIGSFVGPWYGLATIFLGSAIGSVFSLGLIALKLKTRKDRIAFGPFLALAALLLVLWGEQITNLYWQLFV